MTRTELFLAGEVAQGINEYESKGWQVKLIVPLIDSQRDLPGSFAREVLVTFEPNQ